ncbi:bifunctional adenosylcobinamide kinase/adenosylcobinamide-phosphate guanylyltransferase [uncultured Sneathiella sp.]|jgi:adenosylcobinamide kinase/adenosylcobinamide-phosphate guanylyltransferase|uniref:bifunctional adenosylcobinamide kinase/adenosylcobinamide-phosphate guanylyltransferase n=1 Tax=uncultured Sneathiella sp. TaxID=879315 RepID=UPI0030D85779|tara:strand:+ start:31581 stop:32093 length:513 start_codon:yes stop_codon:yes gene_type:complete
MSDDIILVLGGARSGKSRFAEDLVINQRANRIYLATAESYDSEMDDRIRQHQQDRGASWMTIEEPLKLADALKAHSRNDNIVLVDCLTLWLSNLMGRDSPIDAEFDNLIAAIEELSGPVVFVSNEVGQGIVPDNALARAFRDHAGRLHQRLAEISKEVYFITAGLPQKLK